MARRDFKPHVSSHERKLSKKERKQQMANAPKQEVVPTQEDTVQIKNLALYSMIGIGILLFIMYRVFINSI